VPDRKNQFFPIFKFKIVSKNGKLSQNLSINLQKYDKSN
jgi:hypothetical protein